MCMYVVTQKVMFVVGVDILDIERQHYNQRLKQEIETTSDLLRLKGAVYEYITSVRVG